MKWREEEKGPRTFAKKDPNTLLFYSLRLVPFRNDDDWFDDDFRFPSYSFRSHRDVLAPLSNPRDVFHVKMRGFPRENDPGVITRVVRQ